MPFFNKKGIKVVKGLKVLKSLNQPQYPLFSRRARLISSFMPPFSRKSLFWRSMSMRSNLYNCLAEEGKNRLESL